MNRPGFARGDGDARGPHRRARLLANPGKEVQTLDLAIEGAPVDTPRPLWVPVLGAAGEGAYRSQIADLREELNQAERCADVERAERVPATELESLVDEQR